MGSKSTSESTPSSSETPIQNSIRDILWNEGDLRELLAQSIIIKPPGWIKNMKETAIMLQEGRSSLSWTQSDCKQPAEYFDNSNQLLWESHDKKSFKNNEKIWVEWRKIEITLQESFERLLCVEGLRNILNNLKRTRGIDSVSDEEKDSENKYEDVVRSVGEVGKEVAEIKNSKCKMSWFSIYKYFVTLECIKTLHTKIYELLKLKWEHLLEYHLQDFIKIISSKLPENEDNCRENLLLNALSNGKFDEQEFKIIPFESIKVMNEAKEEVDSIFQKLKEYEEVNLLIKNFVYTFE